MNHFNSLPVIMTENTTEQEVWFEGSTEELTPIKLFTC